MNDGNALFERMAEQGPFRESEAGSPSQHHAWQYLEAPLHSLDPELYRFAAMHHTRICRNRDGWPSRTIEWTRDIECTIHIQAENGEPPAYTLRVSAGRKSARCRRVRHLTLRSAVSIETIRYELPALLDAAYRLASSWEPDDMEIVMLQP